MSFLSEELKRQMAIARTNPLQLSERIKISSGQIYKWVNSEQTSIDEKQLTALATALSRKKEMHASLVKAHLMDEKFGPASDLVVIELAPAINQDALHEIHETFPTEGEAAFQFIAQQRARNPDANALLISLARALGMKFK